MSGDNEYEFSDASGSGSDSGDEGDSRSEEEDQEEEEEEEETPAKPSRKRDTNAKPSKPKPSVSSRGKPTAFACHTCKRQLAVYTCKCGDKTSKCCTHCCARCRTVCKLNISCAAPGCSVWFPATCKCTVNTSTDLCIVTSGSKTLCEQKKTRLQQPETKTDKSSSRQTAHAGAKPVAQNMLAFIPISAYRAPDDHPPHTTVFVRDFDPKHPRESTDVTYQTCMFEHKEDCRHFLEKLRFDDDASHVLATKLCEIKGQWWNMFRDNGCSAIRPPSSQSLLELGQVPIKSGRIQISHNLTESILDSEAIGRGYVDIMFSEHDAEILFKRNAHRLKKQSDKSSELLPLVLIKQITLSNVKHNLPFAVSPCFITVSENKTSHWSPNGQRTWTSVLSTDDSHPVVSINDKMVKVAVVLDRYESSMQLASSLRSFSRSKTTAEKSETEADTDNDATDRAPSPVPRTLHKKRAAASTAGAVHADDENYNVPEGSASDTDSENATDGGGSASDGDDGGRESKKPKPERAKRRRSKRNDKSRDPDRHVLFDHVLHRCAFLTCVNYGNVNFELEPKPDPVSGAGSDTMTLRIGAIGKHARATGWREYFLATYFEDLVEHVLPDQTKTPGVPSAEPAKQLRRPTSFAVKRSDVENKRSRTDETDNGGALSTSFGAGAGAGAGSDAGAAATASLDSSDKKDALVIADSHVKISKELRDMLKTDIPKTDRSKALLAKIDKDTIGEQARRKDLWAKFTKHLSRQVHDGDSKTLSFSVNLKKSAFESAFEAWKRSVDPSIGLASSNSGFGIRLWFIGNVAADIDQIKSKDHLHFAADLQMLFYECKGEATASP